jgi:hypothetical protein
MTKCNYFGLKDDPKTALDFPSFGNYCHHANPAASPNTAHQKAYCLSENHKSCPVFLLSETGPLPRDAAVIDNESNVRENFSYRILGGFLILLAIGLVGAWVVFGNSSSAIAIPEGTISVHSTNPIFDENSGSLQSTGPTGTLDLTRAACPPPDGSIRYTVAPNDSIFQLSLTFEVKVVDLLSANCLGDGSVIQAGEILYIPPKRTSTPTKPAYVSPTATTGITPFYTPTETREVQAKPPNPQPTNTPVPVVPTDVPEPPTPTSPPPPTSPPEQPPPEPPPPEPPPPEPPPP